MVELKSDRGRISKPQAKWLYALHVAGVEHYVWRPRDWPVAKEVLWGLRS